MKSYYRVLAVVGLMAVIGCTYSMPPRNTASSSGNTSWQAASNPVQDDINHMELNGDSAGTAVNDQSPDQRLLDSALEFYQTSNEFWQQGDLENAIDALDKSYSLILEISEKADQTVLQQKEDVRITIAKRIMEVYASRFHVVNGHSNAIPLVMNAHVEKALKSFKGRERRFFLESYKRSGKYRDEIVKALKEEGLPEELCWLPLIESGFKVRAMSKARALGMWQFIASTGHKFGLERNAWVDERMDPQKSTRAAIAYLKELHGIFGDWTTALAAYNCGEGNVLRAIRKQRMSYLDNFWDLYTRLPYETASYVPRFLAVLHIINDPQAHGFDLPEAYDPSVFETVTIDKQLHLRTIAKNIGLPYSELKGLNPELRKHVTPKEPYSLKVPTGKAEILLAKVDGIPMYVPPVPPYIVHRVRNGESLSVIAEKYRTSVRAIMAMNNLRKSSFIRAGWKLKVPTGKRKSYRSSRPPVQAAKVKGNLLEYTVQKGDSLWEIANRYNTTVRAIRSLNQLRSTTLTIGQVLLIPQKKTAFLAPSKQSNTGSAKETPPTS